MPRYANQGTCKWIYPITFGGGLVGGDHISLEIVIGRGCCGLVTSAESLKVPGRKEGNVLFNYELNTFYLRLYGVRHMVKYHTDSERKPVATTWATLFD